MAEVVALDLILSRPNYVMARVKKESDKAILQKKFQIVGVWDVFLISNDGRIYGVETAEMLTCPEGKFAVQFA